MLSKIRALAALLIGLLIALAVVCFSTPASADPLKVENIKEALNKCEKNLQRVTDALGGDRTEEELRKCKDLLDNATGPSSPFPNTNKKNNNNGKIKWRCSPENSPKAGCYESGNDVKCKDPRYVAVAHAHWTHKVCVLKDTDAGQIQSKADDLTKNLKKCEDPAHANDPECKAKQALSDKVNNTMPDLLAIEKVYCPVIPGKPDATMEERCQYEHDRMMGTGKSGGVGGVDINAFASVAYRGSGGVGFEGGITLLPFVYVVPREVAVEAKLGFGQFVGGNVNGDTSLFIFGVGARWDFSPPFSLHLGFEDDQYIADAPAGSYGGTLISPFNGNAAGGAVALQYNLPDAAPLHVGLDGFVGYGKVNIHPDNFSTQLKDEVQFRIGVYIGVHPF